MGWRKPNRSLSVGAEGAGGVGEGGAAGGDDAGDGGSGGQGEDGEDENGRVNGFDFVELRFHKTNTEKGRGDADGEAEKRLAEGAAHDHGDDTGGASAQSHANADFGGASRDGVGGEAVEAKRGEKKSEDAEERGEAGDETVFGELFGDLLVEGLKFHDSEIGIDLGESLPGELLHVGDWSLRLEDDGAGVEGDVAFHGAFVARGALHHGIEVHAVVIPAYGLVDSVFDDADDFEIASGIPITAKMPAQRVVARLEIVFDKSFVDDGDSGCG